MGAMKEVRREGPGGHGRYLVPATVDLQVRTVLYIVGGEYRPEGGVTWSEVRKAVEHGSAVVEMGSVRLDEREILHAQWMGAPLEVPKWAVADALQCPAEAYRRLGGVIPWPLQRSS